MTPEQNPSPYPWAVSEHSIPQLVVQLFLLTCQTPASGLCVVVIMWAGNRAEAVFHNSSWNVYTEWGVHAVAWEELGRW